MAQGVGARLPLPPAPFRNLSRSATAEASSRAGLPTFGALVCFNGLSALETSLVNGGRTQLADVADLPGRFGGAFGRRLCQELLRRRPSRPGFPAQLQGFLRVGDRALAVVGLMTVSRPVPPAIGIGGIQLNGFLDGQECAGRISRVILHPRQAPPPFFAVRPQLQGLLVIF